MTERADPGKGRSHDDDQQASTAFVTADMPAGDGTADSPGLDLERDSKREHESKREEAVTDE